MKYKKTIILLALVVFLLSIAGVSASEIGDTIASEDTGEIELSHEMESADNNLGTSEEQTVTQTDNEEKTGETDDGTFAALNQKIQNAGNGSEITLENDYKYEGTGYPNGISITKRLTIDGKGHTIDAKGQARIFNISQADNVTIKNITFINAKATYNGGAIHCWHSYNISVYGCTFINNTAGGYSGGAIYCDRENLTISECSFVNNSANTGGAIYSIHDSVISNCSFVNNSAIEDGGAIYSIHDSVISNCSFMNNSARGNGGAIFLLSGTISNCSFVKNSAGENAGAAALNGFVIISDCSFANNSAVETAGALRFVVAIGTTVSGCDFVNNSANTGGAIYWLEYSKENNLYDCNFVNNSAIEDGGAIVYCNGEHNVISGCTFTNNTASKNSRDYGGGAIYWLGYSKENNVFDCDFVSNSAGNGGAIYCYRSSEDDVFDCDFVSNSAVYGGAIYWHDKYTQYDRVSKCSFVNNSAIGDGGAIYMYWQMSDSSITDCVFVGNHAVYNGGAMEFGGFNCSVNGCYFMNNSAIRGNSIYPRILDICNNIFLYYNDEIYHYDIMNIYCNWCGHNATNYLEGPNLECSVWLFLNATSNPSPVSLMDPAEITFKLYAYDSNSGTISEYDNTLLKTLNLTITPTRGNVNVTTANFGQSIKYTPFGLGEDEITAKIENVFYKFQFNVIKTDPNLSVENQEATYGESIMTVLNYKPNATGKINITLNGRNGNIYAFTDIDLNATLSLGLINADEYEVTVKYSGDANFTNASAEGTLRVVKANSTLTVNDITFDYNGTGVSEISSTGAVGVDASVIGHGEAVITVNDSSITVSGLDAGNYTLTMTTIPDANHNPVTKTVNVTVNKVDSTLAVDNITFDYNGSGSGNVSFTGASGVNASVIDQSEAVVNVTGNTITMSGLDAGNYTLTVTTIPDANHNPVTVNATITVNKLKTDLTASEITTTYNINKDLVITLKDANGNTLAGFNVTVDLNGAKTYTTDKNGQVKVSTKGLAPKAYSAKITFNGNTNYVKSTKKVKVTVKKATPKLTAKKKTFKTTPKTKKYTIVLKDNTGKAIKKAKVTLKVKGKTYKATTNSKGKATFKITNLNKKGTFKATITYKGNKYYNKVSKKANINVIVTFKTVSKGSKDKATVKEIQRALKNKGYYLTYQGHYLKVDGKFSSCTFRSVKEFQHDNGLKVTGKVDEKTAKKLGII